MNPNEYAAMASVESSHWWFEGTRRCFETVMRRAVVFEEFKNRPAIDVGCGTGGNLKWLQQQFQSNLLWGFDASDVAVEYASKQNPDASVWAQDLSRAEDLSSEIQPHLVVCSDVLYCIDRSAGTRGLKVLCDRLPPQGCLLLHLPACQWLYSEHDAAVGTLQRYTKRDVVGILQELGLKVELITYRMFLLFPLVVLRRLKSILLGVNKDVSAAHSELVLPHRLINWFLGRVVAIENLGLSMGLKYPIGSSLIAIGRKP